MTVHHARLRVAFVAGSLGQGGAEKQLVYMVQALLRCDVDVRVYALTRGEHHEAALRALGVDVEWIGAHRGPPRRVLALVRALRRHRPHIVQSAHFFTNLYVALAARAVGAFSIGAVRNDGVHDVSANGIWGPWLLRLPSLLLTNSEAARNALHHRGISGRRLAVLPNVIDAATLPVHVPHGGAGCLVIGVARLARRKRLDRWLHVIAAARRIDPRIRGLLVGRGPEQGRLEAQAAALGLLPHGVRFSGARDDVPQLLADADVLLLTSAHEGFPNVVLEAMAAGLPVVTAPAGDAGVVVVHGVTGYVVEGDNTRAMALRLVTLAHDAALAARFGAAGRERALTVYGLNGLGDRLLELYATAARRTRRAALRTALSRSAEPPGKSPPGQAPSTAAAGLS